MWLEQGQEKSSGSLIDELCEGEALVRWDGKS